MKMFKFLTLAVIVSFTGSIASLSYPALASKSGDKFIHKASEANMFEIESSKLALDKSQNADVKQFAQNMIDDHTAAGTKLKDAVAASGGDQSQIANQLDTSHQQQLNRLKMLSPKDFDKEYVSDQKDAHKDAVKLFSDYSKNGDDASLKEFAGNTLPTLKEHREHIKTISSNM